MAIAHRFHKLVLASAVLLLSAFSVLGTGSRAFADELTCTPPAASQPGVARPTGADAATFSYQCTGPYAGEWTNGYYVYNPATGLRAPTYSLDYVYDCATGIWTMTEWDYSAASGKFFSSRVVAPSAPGLPTNCPAAAPAAASGGTANASGTPTDPAAGTAISATGPNSSNTTGGTLNLNATGSNDTQIGMQNTIGSNAASGNTFVVGNTTGGSAGSGDASAVANIANMLQSTTNAFNPNTTVFTANINGDVNGDFMFDPNAILAAGPGSTNTAANNLQVNVANTNNTGAAINNNVDVGAASGNATVASNTSGGDATSGNASAVVNLMNLINSTVATGKSFVGTININGDLNGDILLPPDVLNALLASSTGPNSTNAAANTVTANSTATNNATLASTTNVSSSTATGNASVTGNTTGGSATSGNSGSNITLLNLTGSNVIGKDDLLVFVNVLGKWVGMIMNAPSGTTAAELGGGITSNVQNTGPSSSNTVSNNAALNSQLVNNADLAITNNVNVHAKSGDASVTQNTAGGNAHSGNAHTAVNVLNMEGSNLSLSDWFGVLFINVFGIWNGSFGVNTAAGDPIAPPVGPSNPNVPTNNNVQAATHQAMLGSLRTVASFSPRSASGSASSGASSDSDHSDPTTGPTASGSFRQAAVLGSTTDPSRKHVTKSHASYSIPLIGFCVAILILIAGERDRIFRKNK